MVTHSGGVLGIRWRVNTTIILRGLNVCAIGMRRCEDAGRSLSCENYGRCYRQCGLSFGPVVIVTMIVRIFIIVAIYILR